ncbi:ESX secretion-associated protein EspG [Amycolatopsis sp. cg5]|uniref:ESX secretion-associated protein EspG n=1 Tax=Amycolatopsis sp. cg5 TaxID=3238802 RepID=UPI003525DC21
MLVLSREVVLPVDCLVLGAAIARVPLPVLIEPEPVWRSPDAERVQRDRVLEILAAEGFWDGERLSEDFEGTLVVLGRGNREFSAVVESPAIRYRLQVAAIGRAAVFACYVPESGQVLLRRARADALAEDLVLELPDVPAGTGWGISVPESDLRDAIDGAPPRRDVRQVLDLVALPRTGGGQIYAGFRDGVHAYRRTGDSCCTFYDTEYGRYVFSFSGEPGYERYVNVAQGRADTLVAKAYEMLDQLS